MSIHYTSPSDKIGYRKFFAKAVEALLADASGWDFHSGNVHDMNQRHLSLMALEYEFRVTYVHESGLAVSARGKLFTDTDGTKPEVDITEVYFMSFDAGTSNCPAPVAILNDNLPNRPQISNVDAWAMNILQRGGISAELVSAETILANLKEEGFFDE